MEVRLVSLRKATGILIERSDVASISKAILRILKTTIFDYSSGTTDMRGY